MRDHIVTSTERGRLRLDGTMILAIVGVIMALIAAAAR